MKAMRNWGLEAQEAAEEHLDLCSRWQEFYESGSPEEERPPGVNPAIDTFCGCTTCMVRETLHAAWPIIEAGVRSGDFG